MGYKVKSLLFGTISRKGMFATGITLLLILVFTYINLTGINNIEASYQKVTEDSFSENIALIQIDQSLSAYHTEVLEYIISGNVGHLDEAKAQKKIYLEHKKNILKLIEFSPDWDLFRSKLEAVDASYFPLVDQMIESKRTGTINDKQISKQINKAELTTHPFESALKERKNHESNELSIQTAAVLKSTNRARKESIRIVLIILLLGICLSGYAYNSISKPIKNLHDAAEKLEKGKFGEKVDVRTGDELEDLGNALNKASSALSKVELERKQIDKAKTEFLSITSHELRSPMTPMRAQLQMLLEEYFGKLNKKQRDAVNIVLNNTVRLDGIILDLLEVSRIEAARLKFNFVKTNLADHITTLLEEMKGFMPEKNVQLIADIGDLPDMEVDPQRTMQVLRNLVNNAIKFTPSGGKVEITARREDNQILFEIKDSGIGISEEKQKRIFEPFFQAEQTIYRKQGGTGLGLTICRGIVESQKGRIWVNSQEGKGTTFSFTVPLIPVKETSPIKLMFSEQAGINKKVETLFKELLGPMGSKEFNNISKKGDIAPYDIYKYINYLIEAGIIEPKTGFDFKRKAVRLFGGQSIESELEELFIRVLGPLGKRQLDKLGSNLNKINLFGLVDMLKQKDILTRTETQQLKRSISDILKGDSAEKAVTIFFGKLESDNKKKSRQFFSSLGDKKWR